MGLLPDVLLLPPPEVLSCSTVLAKVQPSHRSLQTEGQFSREQEHLYGSAKPQQDEPVWEPADDHTDGGQSGHSPLPCLPLKEAVHKF